jgi:type II secretory ATPase GspE/PulE/Tfp pilus assembly ATPase PilB-like protein
MPVSQAVAGLKTGVAAVMARISEHTTVYAGKGCNACNNTGFIGRSALFQFIEITPEMQELMLHSPSTQEIEALARKQGSQSMFDDGIDKVKAGVTTVAEVLRVVEPPKKVADGSR